jgi:hypothetical protein
LPPAEGETCLAFLVLPIGTGTGLPAMAVGARAPGGGAPPHGPPPLPYADPHYPDYCCSYSPPRPPRPNEGCSAPQPGWNLQPPYPGYYAGYYLEPSYQGYYYPPLAPQDCDYYGCNDPSTHGAAPPPPPPVPSEEAP